MKEKNKVTLEEFKENFNNFNNFLSETEKAETTIKAYSNAILHFLIFASDYKVIDKQMLIDYKKYLNNISNSTNTRNLWITVLNKYFKFINVKLRLNLIRSQNRFINKDYMSLADYKRLLREAKKEKMVQDYYIIKTLAMSGIRVSELKFFTVENLKIENKNIFNKGKERELVISDKLAKELRHYCREFKIKEGFIFRSITNPQKIVCTSTLWKHLKKIASIAKVKKSIVHAHSFRHLFADRFLEKHPGDTLTLQDLLGHENPKTTSIYVKKNSQARKRIVNDIEF